MESIGYIVDEDFAGQRLDSVLAQTLPDKTRSQWQKLIEAQQVLVNDKPATKDQTLKQGDPITVLPSKITKTAVKLPVIYEDDDVIVIDKPAGLLVHSKGKADQDFTVVDALKDKINIEDSNRPGIVHRLDRDTSGVMIVAKTEATKEYLQRQFSNRQVNKTYLALVDGSLKQNEALLRWPIERNPKQPSTFRVGKNGKPAETYIKVLAKANNQSLVECHPKTGRTHQLRVHLAHLGHPIVGDRFYNGSPAERLMLHAKELEISIRHNDRKVFKSKLPIEFNI